MKTPFDRDILIINFKQVPAETEQLDPTMRIGAVYQMAALRLDPETLEQTGALCSYITNNLSISQRAQIQGFGVEPAQLRGAPTVYDLAYDFVNQFGTDFILCSWEPVFDQAHLRKLMIGGEVNLSDFSIKLVNLRELAVNYLAQRGGETTTPMDQIYSAFGISPISANNALSDCESQATVLRTIANKPY